MLATSDVLDRWPEAVVCNLPTHLLGLRKVVCGRLRTVDCFEDNALVRAVLGERSAGEVLVVHGGGSLRTALLGDQIAAMALTHGWAGVIVFGAVRDALTLAGLDFHVKCLGFNPRKSGKTGIGKIDGVLKVGDVEFRPGDTVWSDPDGVVLGTGMPEHMLVKCGQD